jgi:ankyrin repeat protein
VTRAGVALLALALVACLGARRLQGPVSGVVETSDGTNLPDVVVRLGCREHGLHGSWPSDEETRIVATGTRFRFWWAWGGLAPAGCHLAVHHPLYQTAHIPIGDAFATDFGTVRLRSFDELLSAGPGDRRADPSHPWPTMELQAQLFDSVTYFAREHPEESRPALARYVPALHSIFDRALGLLSTSWHDDSSWNRDRQKELRAFEAAVGWERPAAQRALAEAAAAGDAERVRSLLVAGAPADAWGPDGAAPLHSAAAAGHTGAVAALLEGGADIDRQREGRGATGLIEAVGNHREETALWLLEQGADPTIAAWRGSPLEVAALGNARPRVVRALCERGAMAKASDRSRAAHALQIAAGRDHTSVMQVLLEAGLSADAKADASGTTALMAAARAGNLRAARLLLAAGAGVAARAQDGATPLSLARAAGRTEMISLLEAAGARE